MGLWYRERTAFSSGLATKTVKLHFPILEETLLGFFLPVNLSCRRGGELSYWQTLDNRYEVDVVIGDATMAIEIKSSKELQSQHLRVLYFFQTGFCALKRLF